MRLWHEKLLPYLSKQRLQGQHREICALRGGYWGKRHYIVDYIFNNNYLKLTHYHFKIIQILIVKYKVNIDRLWLYDNYRGKQLGFQQWLDLPNSHFALTKFDYEEHNDQYLSICLHNLKYAKNEKGIVKNIDLFKHFNHIKDLGYDLNEYEKEIRKEVLV